MRHKCTNRLVQALTFNPVLVQLKRRPATNYMETVQHDINASMRGILIDWLVEVSKPLSKAMKLLHGREAIKSAMA